jgi:dolichol-phosphate mannosyltransferase
VLVWLVLVLPSILIRHFLRSPNFGPPNNQQGLVFLVPAVGGFQLSDLMIARIRLLIVQLLLLIAFVASQTKSDAAAADSSQICDPQDNSKTCANPTSLPNNMIYSVILPTYNERENLPIITQFLHDSFTSAELKYEIVVVDDSSPDNTLEVAQTLQKLFGKEHIQIVSRPGKLGLGSAYSVGLKASSGDRIILMDADLSHHPKFIPEMIAAMDKQKVDIVSGTRYRPGGGVAGWDTFRKLTSCGANFLASFLLSTGGASDLTGSFRLYERSAIELILPQVHSKGYAFQMEILVRAHKAKLKIGEVPITFVDRIYGESKLGANEIIMYLKGLLKLFLTT